MESSHSARFGVLERWRSALFLVAGGVLVVFAATLAIQEVTATVIPQNAFGPLGFAIGFLGLLGLYPGVVTDVPRLAAAGALLAILGAGGFVVAWLVALVEVAGGTAPAWVELANGPILAGMVLGFLAFAIAVKRSDAYAGQLAVLLLVPAVLLALNVARVELVGAENVRLWVSFLFATGQALAYLGIGITLRAEPAPTEARTRTTDSAA